MPPVDWTRLVVIALMAPGLLLLVAVVGFLAFGGRHGDT
jgi:hypothetical protein